MVCLAGNWLVNWLVGRICVGLLFSQWLLGVDYQWVGWPVVLWWLVD